MGIVENTENSQIKDKPSLLKIGIRERTILSTTIFGLLFAAVLIAGSQIGEDSLRVDLLDIFALPGLEHPFGTDWVGRDMLQRTIKGLSLSMKIGILCSLSSGFIAAILGVAGPILGGKVDAIISWLIP